MRPRRVEPGPGQESERDHPGSPATDRFDHHVVVSFADEVVGPCKGGPGTMGW